MPAASDAHYYARSTGWCMPSSASRDRDSVCCVVKCVASSCLPGSAAGERGGRRLTPSARQASAWEQRRRRRGSRVRVGWLLQSTRHQLPGPASSRRRLSCWSADRRQRHEAAQEGLPSRAGQAHAATISERVAYRLSSVNPYAALPISQLWQQPHPAFRLRRTGPRMKQRYSSGPRGVDSRTAEGTAARTARARRCRPMRRTAGPSASLDLSRRARLRDVHPACL